MGKPLNKFEYMTPYIVSKYGLVGLLSAMQAELNWLKTETVSPGLQDQIY